MARMCCIESCEGLSSEDVTYFPFPIKPALRRRWRAALAPARLPAEPLLCSRHFAPEQCQTVRGKLRLRANVVPTRFARNGETLPIPKHIENSTSEGANGRDSPFDHDSDDAAGERLNNNTEEPSDNSMHENGNQRDDNQDDGNQEDSIKEDSNQVSDKEDRGSCKVKSKVQELGDDGNEEVSTKRSEGDENQEIVDQEKAEDETGESVEQDKADDDTGESIKPAAAVDDKGEGMEQEKTVDEIGESVQQAEAVDDKRDSMDQDEEEYMSLDQFVDCNIEENVDENCTIECMPEAILGPEDESSGSEADLHKGDIEDIIANYHIKQDEKLAARLKAAQSEQPKGDVEDIIANYQIKQDKKMAARLKAAQEKEAKEAEKRKTAEQEATSRKPPEQEASRREACARSPPPTRDLLDDDSVEFVDSTEQLPVFVEISVDAVGEAADGAADDCMMLLEKVQVDIDPSSLFPPEPPDSGGDDSSVEEVPIRKPDPISLLTSSDSDELILEEPHVDTVDVSDETDEDDVPLVKLVKPFRAVQHLNQIVWGTRQDYYCYRCNYTSGSHAESVRHQIQHQLSTVINVCQVCSFSTASAAQFARHKKKHKEEKRFKCHLCDYRAKHQMSLGYHMRTHAGVLAHDLAEVKQVKRLKCSRCKVACGSKTQLARHVRRCAGASALAHACTRCPYSTSRSSDLRRHMARKHRASSDDSDEYVPGRAV